MRARLAGPLVASLVVHLAVAAFLSLRHDRVDVVALPRVEAPRGEAVPALRRRAAVPRLDVVVANAAPPGKATPVRVELLVVRALPKDVRVEGQALAARRVRFLLPDLPKPAEPPQGEPAQLPRPARAPVPPPPRGTVPGPPPARPPDPPAPPPLPKRESAPDPLPPPPTPESAFPEPLTLPSESTPIVQAPADAPEIEQRPPAPVGTPVEVVEAPKPSPAEEPATPKAPEPPPTPPPAPPPALAGEPPALDLRRLELTRRLEFSRRGVSSSGAAAARQGEAQDQAGAEGRAGGQPASVPLVAVGGGGGGERRATGTVEEGLAVKAPEPGPGGGGGAVAAAMDRTALARILAASSFGAGASEAAGPPKRRLRGAPVAARDVQPGARFVSEGGRGSGTGQGAADGAGGAGEGQGGAPKDAREGGAARTGGVLTEEALPFIQGRVQTITTLGHPSQARGLHGTALLRLRMNRGGYLTQYELLRSTGHPVLDEEIPRLLELAAPFPYVEGWVVLSVAF